MQHVDQSTERLLPIVWFCRLLPNAQLAKCEVLVVVTNPVMTEALLEKYFKSAGLANASHS